MKYNNYLEQVEGKNTFNLDGATLYARLRNYREILVDIGTGDGRYVQQMTRLCPTRFMIGIDACRENLREVSRKPQPNALYLIANAEALPAELNGQASAITINFPWGSLLTGLLDSRSELLSGLQQLAQPGAKLEIRLNSSALQKEGYSLEQGGALVQKALLEQGFKAKPLQKLDARILRDYPTTWAKRLAYGRDPYALYTEANCPGLAQPEPECFALAGKASLPEYTG